MKRITSLLAITVALICVAWTTYNTQGSFKLTWTYTGPTANVVAYWIYWGTNSFYDGGGNPLITLPPGTQSVQVPPPTTTYTVSSLPVGVKYYFVVTAKTSDGLESVPSNQVTNIVPLVSVPPPSNLVGQQQ